VRTLRNIAIIAGLAFIVAAVPGGGEAARGLVAALTIGFLVALGFAGYQLYRQNRLALLSLDERARTALLVALGAIVLMVAGADELTATGLGLLVWVGVLGLSIFALVRVWTEAHRSY
jgi:hypothetical protein